MRKSFVGAALCAVLASAKELFPQLCLNTISDGQKLTETSLVLQGDMNIVAKLPANDAAFVRPSSVKICADNEQVYGIQFTLKVHEPEFEHLRED